MLLGVGKDDKLKMMPSTAVGLALQPLRWTSGDLDRLESIGILPERYELLGGEIFSKMGQGIPHRRAVGVLMHWMQGLWGVDFVQTQATIGVAPEDAEHNRPEPDLAALRVPLSTLTGNPAAEEVELVVEVADATLAQDLSRKAELYARAGIPEYWVFDVRDQVMHVHRTPIRGSYRSIVARTAEVAALPHPLGAIDPQQIL
jgi:Uma2 family endonuclease